MRASLIKFNRAKQGYFSKRSMYGRAKFDLLRLRVLHHPAKREVAQDAKTGVDHQRRRNRTQQLRAEENTFTSQPTTVRISEVA